MKSGLLLTVASLAISSSAALAQYPGHIETEKKAEASSLRSVAVLESTGDPKHPSATRLVPVSLFDGERLEDGGLYLARPVPLALDSGTEYEVESSGVPQGWYDLKGARQIGTDWFGVGDLKPYVPPPPKKLHPSSHPPTVVRDKTPNDDRPHFVRRDQQPTQTTSNGSTPAQSSQQPTATQSSPAPVDPDRPKLRRRPDEDRPAETASAPAESPSATPDPDRPHLGHGVPTDLKNDEKPLEVTPVDMNQRVAVSDADKVAPQTWAYEWSSAGDAANAQKELEAEAVRLLSASPASGGAAAPPARPPVATHSARATATHTRPRSARVAGSGTATSRLSDVRFHAFVLTSGSSATLVLTARETANARSIAVVAQQDIYGKIVVIWHSITDDQHLDVTPAMKLVDAVDPRGDGRANLLFEERNTTDRRFVLYAVGANTAQQVFASDPLPLHSVAAPTSE